MKREQVNKPVTIVGAGMAGLSAALRLAERGYNVTLLEKAHALGGQFGVQRDESMTSKGDVHEHCYHMFLNWYHNFWALTRELEPQPQFASRHAIKYRARGDYGCDFTLADVGSPATFLSNMFSGPLPPADMFLYGYSLIDLLSQPIHRQSFLDQYSINGFMRARPYATDRAAEQHHRNLAKAFASPSYRTSAASYQHFIKYGFKCPTPMLWVLVGDCDTHIMEPLRRKLRALDCEILCGHQVSGVKMHNGRISALTARKVARKACELCPDPEATSEEPPGEFAIEGDVIFAIPPRALCSLLNADMYAAAPELAELSKLKYEAIASLDLYFNKKLKGIPQEHMVLLKSKYDLTFIDNSQIWPDKTATTFLNVVASDFAPLATLLENAQLHGNGTHADAIERVKKMIITELHDYIDFDDADIDWSRTYLRPNIGEKLFVMETGTWKIRPNATTAIANAYLAGDFCRSSVDVVTVESALITGLNAAKAICERDGVGPPIEIIEPEAYPPALMGAAKMALSPYAASAKAWSWTSDQISDAFADVLPR